MRMFREGMIFSFKLMDRPERELKIQRTYVRQHALHIDTVYAEFTDTAGVLCVPDAILSRHQDASPHGFAGVMKPGVYAVNGQTLDIDRVSHIYNGVGYIHVANLDAVVSQPLEDLGGVSHV